MSEWDRNSFFSRELINTALTEDHGSTWSPFTYHEKLERHKRAAELALMCKHDELGLNKPFLPKPVRDDWEDQVKFLWNGLPWDSKKEKKLKHKKVIFNDPVTVVFWEDGTNTKVRCAEGDTFDKATGYLQAYFRKSMGESKTQCAKFLQEVVNKPDYDKSGSKKVTKKKSKKKQEK